MTYSVDLFYEGKGWIEVAQVSGCEAAYEAYRRLCEFAEIVGALDVALVDVETAEVVANWADSDEE